MFFANSFIIPVLKIWNTIHSPITYSVEFYDESKPSDVSRRHRLRSANWHQLVVSCHDTFAASLVIESSPSWVRCSGTYRTLFRAQRWTSTVLDICNGFNPQDPVEIFSLSTLLLLLLLRSPLFSSLWHVFKNILLSIALFQAIVQNKENHLHFTSVKRSIGCKSMLALQLFHMLWNELPQDLRKSMCNYTFRN